MNKYRAKRTQCGICGVWCHSGAEARRCAELDLLQRAGQIQRKENQPKFRLHAYGGEPIGKDGKYIADFSYYQFEDGEWRRVIEDVKGGEIPPLSKWKIKHAEAEYNFKVQIVRMRKCSTTATIGKIAKSRRFTRVLMKD